MREIGTQGVYDWLVTDKDFDLLDLCPEIVIGKYVAITSIDSGALVPTEEEMAAGWRNHSDIAYSPRIQTAKEVPHAGWDEWYIFEHPVDLGTSHLRENVFEVPHEEQHISVFVNYNFAFHQGDMMKVFADMFWKQIAWIQPESYVADNHSLSFATANKPLFAAVRGAVEALK